jgi:hypothetical protein
MRLLSRALQAFAPAGPAMASGPSPQARQESNDLLKVLTDFREQRAADFAQIADRAGRSGARLAETEARLDQWRTYAHELERLCMAHGIEMPAAPDEDA